MKRVLPKIALFIAVLTFAFFPLVVQASDSDISFSEDAQSLSGQVMILSEDTKAYASPSETSEAKQSFSKGESVFVVEEADDWYQIFYKGEQLYIPSSSFDEKALDDAKEQAAELAQEASDELKAAEKRDVVEIETIERQRESYRNSIIWKIVIGVLVAIIIIISVIIGIKNARSDKED